MRIFYLTTTIICLGWTVKAQDTLRTVRLDEVVITGTKTELPVEKSGKTIFKISQEDIESSGANSVADLLNEVPGVQMDGNFGPLGTNIGYFLRGASSKRTLILIDGVPYNDPSGIDQTYDLRLLDLSQVESIEVLKGGLSTLYGTGAAAGVINISLKRPRTEGATGSVNFEYGSFNTFAHTLNLNERKGPLQWTLSGGFLTSDGFSAAADTLGNQDFDDDGYDQFNFLGKVNYDFSDQFSFGATASFDDFNNDYDQGAFTDGDNFSDFHQIRIGITPKLKWSGGKLSANIFYANLSRLFNSPDFFDPSARFIDEYDGRNIQADLVVDQNISSQVKLLGGVNYQRLAYSQPGLEREDFQLIDPYITAIYDQANFNLQIGGRLSTHSEYGANFVWNVNPSYLIEKGSYRIKTYASYATSFIAPSLFQLFGPFGSNPELEPEESQSAEGGLSLLGDLLRLDAVYFFRRDKNLIVFPVDSYENANQEIETNGVEFSGKVELSEKVQISSHYTYINTLNEVILYRVPAHKYGATLRYRPLEGLFISANYLHTGERQQQFFNNATFTTETVDTSAFDLIDLFASYTWRKMTLSSSVNNLFDEEYVAIYGFNSVGRNYTAKIQYAF